MFGGYSECLNSAAIQWRLQYQCIACSVVFHIINNFLVTFGIWSDLKVIEVVLVGGAGGGGGGV